MIDEPKIPLRELPVYMLQTGDMIYSRPHQWFFRCPHNGVVPDEIANLNDVRFTHFIAKDPKAAADWNKARRNELMQ